MYIIFREDAYERLVWKFLHFLEFTKTSKEDRSRWASERLSSESGITGLDIILSHLIFFPKIGDPFQRLPEVPPRQQLYSRDTSEAILIKTSNEDRGRGASERLSPGRLRRSWTLDIILSSSYSPPSDRRFFPTSLRGPATSTTWLSWYSRSHSPWKCEFSSYWENRCRGLPVPSISMGIVGIGTLILLTLHSDDTMEAIFREKWFDSTSIALLS